MNKETNLNQIKTLNNQKLLESDSFVGIFYYAFYFIAHNKYKSEVLKSVEKSFLFNNC